MTKCEITGKRDPIYIEWLESIGAEVHINEWRGSGQEAVSRWSRDKLPDSKTEYFTVTDVDFVFHNYKYNTMMLIEVKSRVDLDKEVKSALDYLPYSQRETLKHLHRSLDCNPKIIYLGFCALRFEGRFFDDGRAHLILHPSHSKAVYEFYKGDIVGFKTKSEMEEFFKSTLCNDYTSLIKASAKPKKELTLYIKDGEVYRVMSKEELTDYHQGWLESYYDFVYEKVRSEYRYAT